MDYIYIILTQTGTAPARFFRFLTKKPYNHVSLASSHDLSEMYSFCRTYKLLPLPSTFNKERVGKGALGSFSFIPCKIYRVKVTAKQKEKYCKIIKHFCNNRQFYSYNMLGLIPLYLNIDWPRKKNFVCSQFVACTMKYIGIELKKPYSLYIPDDFHKFPNSELYYSGELNYYYHDITSNFKYSYNRTPTV